MTPTAWYCVAPVRLAFIVQERQKTERIIFFSSLDKFSLTSCEKVLLFDFFRAAFNRRRRRRFSF